MATKLTSTHYTTRLLSFLSFTILVFSSHRSVVGQVPRVEDPHSFANPAEVEVRHLHLDVEVDFARRIVSGSATYQVKPIGDHRVLHLDTRDLTIQSVTVSDGGAEVATEFALADAVPLLGQRLSIPIKADTRRVEVRYATSPSAAALQWLTAEQTAGRRQPFLFTQSQAILARTWVPCPDSPGIRFSYSARIKVPRGLLAVMSATNPQRLVDSGVYTFEMKQPIPAYLMALAVGDLRFGALGKRTGVYAEPELLDASVYEFGRVEEMLEEAEEMYGPYRWERYDMIVLPPSFPFGGMENPRLTFVTPTILAGDRSLTALVAHELAHSWSGNLVTNATWNDFWLNEGFTVYFERRIMEKLYGTEYVEMLRQLGHQDLAATFDDLRDQPADQMLKLNLAGRDPDEGMTDVAYEKGNFLLEHMEKTVGRERFDRFLREYFDRHAFKSITTSQFLAEVSQHLAGDDAPLVKRLDVSSWVFKPGLPPYFQPPDSKRFRDVESGLDAWRRGTPAAKLETTKWTTHEWLHLLRGLPSGLTDGQFAELDAAFQFTASKNSEIQSAWYQKAIAAGYFPSNVRDALEAFLLRVGRRKFLQPLYKELAATPEGKTWARGVYARARGNYHSISRQTIDDLLK